MNQIMWSTWYGGSLEIADLENNMDLGDGVEIDLTTGLPPILMPSDDPDWDGTLGFGDIYVDAGLEMAEGISTEVSLYLSGMVDFNLVFDNQQNQLSLVPKETAHVWIEVVEISNPRLPTELSELLQEIFASVFSRTAHAYFGVDTSARVRRGGLAGLPASEIWKLNQGVVEKTAGQIRFTGSLQ